MKSSWITVITLLLVVVMVAFGAVSISKLVKDVESSLPADGADNDNDTNTPGDSGNSGDTGNTDDNGNTEEEYLIEMYGAPTFDYDATKSSSTDFYGILFRAKISDFLKTNFVDKGLGKVKWLCIPLDEIEKAGLLNQTNIDWVACLEAAGAPVLLVEPEHAFENKDKQGNWIARFRLESVRYDNINRPIFAIMYFEHNDGTRQYATFPEGETVTTLSRSFGYVCVEAYNQGTLALVSQKDLWPSEVDSGLLKCISLSVGKTLNYDNADAVSAALKYYPIFEADGSYGQNRKVNLTVGGNPYRYDVKTGVYGSNGTFIDCKMPFVSYTTNASVAVVENGYVKPVGAGTCKIWFYCGSGPCSIDVTVT